jgi:hypothetical protein
MLERAPQGVVTWESVNMRGLASGRAGDTNPGMRAVLSRATDAPQCHWLKREPHTVTEPHCGRYLVRCQQGRVNSHSRRPGEESSARPTFCLSDGHRKASNELPYPDSQAFGCPGLLTGLLKGQRAGTPPPRHAEQPTSRRPHREHARYE